MDEPMIDEEAVDESWNLRDRRKSSWGRRKYGFFFSSRRRHTRWTGDWSSDVCSSDLVAALRCDFLAGTGRKFLRGPRGIGFLYVSDRMLERGAFPLFLDMRGADWTDPDAFRLADGASGFENWEFAYALVAGLGGAARSALAVGAGGRERARRLAALLRPQLAEIPGVRVLDRGREQCAIVTVDVAGRDAADLKLRLRQCGINASSADRTSGVRDMDEKGASTVLRFSPHYYNTEDELDTTVAALPDPDEWTLIFSRAADVFHIPYPGEALDALRLRVKPQAETGPFMESLAFYFPAADTGRALLNLHWGETIVQVPLALR